MGPCPTPLPAANLQSWGWSGAPKELRSNPSPCCASSPAVLFQCPGSRPDFQRGAVLRTIRPGCGTAHPAQPRPSVASAKTRGPSASRLGGGTHCPGFSTSAPGTGTNPSAGSGGQALAHCMGLVPPLGSAVSQTLSSPQSERVPQAEESGFGHCMDGRASWSRCRSSRWRRTVPPAHSPGSALPGAVPGLVLLSRGAAEVAADHKLPFLSV